MVTKWKLSKPAWKEHNVSFRLDLDTGHNRTVIQVKETVSSSVQLSQSTFPDQDFGIAQNEASV
jgi:hypothetical protein